MTTRASATAQHRAHVRRPRRRSERRVHNPLERGSLWGELRTEIEERGGTPGEPYAVAGEYDLPLTYDDDVETAIELHGLETKEMPVVSIERLGGLVEDV